MVAAELACVRDECEEATAPYGTQRADVANMGINYATQLYVKQIRPWGD